MPASRRPLGRILTFYSYKGGTGRSMAVANIAWILASGGRSVLMIDWDLEAPGLHRYFRPFLLDEELTASDGLIDLVDRYATAAIQPVDPHAPPKPDWYVDYADFSDHVLSIDYDYFGPSGRLDFLPAGRQGDAYALKVSSFNWQNLYDRLGGGAFFEAFKRRARETYDYVLIDSRTGVSDTAGICSVQMPDTLVVCFTYNNQSIKGAAGVGQWARGRHEQLMQELRAGAAASPAADGAIADSPRPFRIFPVPMRVDAGESDRLALRQAFARAAFRPLTAHLGADLADYWSRVEVPHNVFYAYEEVLAAFKDNPGDPKTVLSALVRTATYVTDRDVTDYRLTINPRDRQRFIEAFAVTAVPAAAKSPAGLLETEDETLVRTAEAALGTLTDEQKPIAQRIFGRLVRLGRYEEGGGLFPIRASFGDFSDAERTVIAALENRGLLSVATLDGHTPSSEPGMTGQTVGFADGRLLRLSKSLIAPLERDREFLLWRQQLRTYIADWERSGHDATALLGGRLLAEATLWQQRRKLDLNAAEVSYLESSASLAARHEAEARAQEERARRQEAQARTREEEARAREEAVRAREREERAREEAARAREREERAWREAALTRAAQGAAPDDELYAQTPTVLLPRRRDSRVVQEQARPSGTARPLRWIGLGAAAALAAAILVAVWLLGSRSGPRSIPAAGRVRDAVIVAAATAASDPLQRALLLLELGPDADAPANARDLAIDLATTTLPWALLQNDAHPITVGRFGSDGNSFTTGSSDGTVRVWMAGKLSDTPLTIASRAGGIVSVAIEPKLRRVLITGGNHIAEVWDLDPQREVSRLPIVSNLLDGAFVFGLPVVVQPQGSGRGSSPFLAQFKGQSAAEYRPDDFIALVTLPRTTSAVRFSASGEWCVAVTSTSLDVWQLAGGKFQRSFDAASPRSVVFSPNGAYLAYGSDGGVSVVPVSGSSAPPVNGTLKSREAAAIAARARELEARRAPSARPTAPVPESVAQAGPPTAADPPIAVSPDGQVVVLTNADGSALPVPVAGGNVPRTFATAAGDPRWLRGHRGQIVDVDFNISGSLIATSGADRTVRFWINPIGRTPPIRPASSTPWSELWKTLRDQTTACLTADERMRLLSEPEAAAREAAGKCDADYGVKVFAASTS